MSEVPLPGASPPRKPGAATPSTPVAERGREQQSPTGGNTHTHTSQHTPTLQQSQLGGRLQEYWQQWRDTLPDSQIYHNVRAGVRWKFKEHPTLSTTPIFQQSRADQKELLVEAAQQLLDKGAVEVLSKEQQNTPGFYSHLFLRPKPTGEYRPIIDLSRLNNHIVCPHFKMETVQSIRQSLQPGEWCTQIDIKDAYLHIPVQHRFRKYLRFTVEGVVYQFKTLPFGLNVAPRIFTQVLKPVLGHLRRQGIRVHGYLDDWIIRGSHPGQTKRFTDTTIKLLTDLGWLISWDKCSLTPSQEFTFLGLRFNTGAGTVAPGRKGLDDLHTAIKGLKSGTRITARTLSSILGKAKHWAPFTRRGKLQLRRSQEWLKRRWTQSLTNWESMVQVDNQLIKQLHWWTLPGNTLPGVPLHPPTPTQELYTDACDTGWGAQLGTLSAKGTWARCSRDLHINRLELKAVHQACLQFREHLTHKVTRVHIDNTTAVAYIRKEGGTRSSALTKDARKLLTWCDRNKVTLVPVHIAGVRNVEADRLSRAGQLLSSEWSITREEFRRIQSHLGTPTLDLFAMADNRVVTKFFSPVPHPEAEAVDALNQEWPSHELLYAYPPTALVPLVLQKVRQSRALSLILVTSTTSTKAWHADLRDLSKQTPLPVARQPGTLWQIPSGGTQRHLHPHPELFNLGAWLIASPQ